VGPGPPNYIISFRRCLQLFKILVQFRLHHPWSWARALELSDNSNVGFCLFFEQFRASCTYTKKAHLKSIQMTRRCSNISHVLVQATIKLPIQKIISIQRHRTFQLMTWIYKASWDHHQHELWRDGPSILDRLLLQGAVRSNIGHATHPKLRVDCRIDNARNWQYRQNKRAWSMRDD